MPLLKSENDGYSSHFFVTLRALLLTYGRYAPVEGAPVS